MMGIFLLPIWLLSATCHAEQALWSDVHDGDDTRLRLRIGSNQFIYDLLPDVAQITREGFALAGIRLVLTDLPPERSLRYASDGTLDGDLFRSDFAVQEHPTLLKIDVPLATLDFYPYVQPQTHCVANVADLAEQSAIKVHGLHYFKVLNGMDINYVHEAPNLVSGVKMLTSGRADFILLPDFAVPAIEKILDTQVKRCLDHPVLTLTLSTYLHEKHRSLIPVLEKTFRQALESYKSREQIP
ncbi:MAG: hypothetical protein LPK85_06490 [Gammaproteobacteria bacterium]|nr:hypothetical protein [Gammaproteobacteria bacterium]